MMLRVSNLSSHRQCVSQIGSRLGVAATRRGKLYERSVDVSLLR